MTVTYNLCESLTGGIKLFCDAALLCSKYTNEDNSMLKIRDIVGELLGSKLYELWKEY